MKKVLLVTLMLGFIGFLAQPVAASAYSLDEQKVDALFEQAETTTMSIFDETAPAHLPALAPASEQSKDPLVAILLDFFVGYLGIHRFYLGTETLTGIGYILTCGGIFGVVPLVDLIVLAINFDDISPYIDNPAFFMW
ncbi:MAG: TM2 domain-containing protein [Bacteroidales bacterium]|nr:TM2 domain-containing protein [Bacteroidales bacterium]